MMGEYRYLEVIIVKRGRYFAEVENIVAEGRSVPGAVKALINKRNIEVNIARESAKGSW